MEDRIGSLEAGELADLIVLDGDATAMVPLYDVYSRPVRVARADDAPCPNTSHAQCACRIDVRRNDRECAEDAHTMRSALLGSWAGQPRRAAKKSGARTARLP